jgi:Tol biopolymer transport system component
MSDRAAPDPITRLNAALEGRYRIERELGAGGMATVYLAHDERHDRNGALKVLKPELAAVVGAERFLAEIKTTANLQHPNILPLFDSGESDGFLWYAMPYVEGESLRERLDRERQLPVEDVVRLGAELAEALDHAHRQGVVHRDIKPANVLMRDGRPMIADFGIALAVGSAGGARLTETGLSLGTPYYMSAEQAVGDQAVTAASDIYALGSVLYELLTGEPPHNAKNAQAVLARIITGEVKSPRTHRPAVPENVDGALRKALERLPADRFGSAKELGEALRDPAFRYGEEPEAGAGGGWVRLAAGAVGGVAVGFLLASMLGSPESGSEDARVPDQRPLQMTFTGQSTAPGISPDGDFVSYVDADCAHGTFGACSYALIVQEVGGAQPVTVVEDARWLSSGRWNHDGSTIVFDGVLEDGREGVFAVPRLGGAIRPLSEFGLADTHGLADTVVVVTPDSAGALTARFISPADGRVFGELPLPLESRTLEGIAWSPDGSRLALIDALKVYLVDRAGALTDTRDFIDRAHIRWSADGHGLLYFETGTVREDDLVRLEVDEAGRFVGEPVTLRAAVQTLYEGQFDVARRTGDVLLRTGDSRGDVWVFDVDDPQGTARRLTAGTTWYGAPGAFDGTAVYFARGDAIGDNLYRMDLETGESDALTSSRSPAGNAARFSRDGTRIAHSRMGEVDHIEYIDLSTGRVMSLDLERSVLQPVPTGDDRFFGLSGGQLVLVDASDRSIRTLPVRTATGSPPAPSPSGDRVAVATGAEGGEGVAVAVVDVASGALAEVLTLEDDEPLPGILWADDGWIYVGRWLDEDPWPTLWRVQPDGGTVERFRELPAPCGPGSITVDHGATIAICNGDEDRFDVWLYEGLGR